jgi:transposase
MQCEKMAVVEVYFRQRAVIEFLVKEGNSAGVIYERIRGVYGDVYMGASSVRRWVKHFKDGNTDIGDHPRSGRQRNCCNWSTFWKKGKRSMQLATFRRSTSIVVVS